MATMMVMEVGAWIHPCCRVYLLYVEQDDDDDDDDSIVSIGCISFHTIQLSG